LSVHPVKPVPAGPIKIDKAGRIVCWGARLHPTDPVVVVIAMVARMVLKALPNRLPILLDGPVSCHQRRVCVREHGASWLEGEECGTTAQERLEISSHFEWEEMPVAGHEPALSPRPFKKWLQGRNVVSP
jgi:hypothetical protein